MLLLVMKRENTSPILAADNYILVARAWHTSLIWITIVKGSIVRPSWITREMCCIPPVHVARIVTCLNDSTLRNSRIGAHLPPGAEQKPTAELPVRAVLWYC